MGRESSRGSVGVCAAGGRSGTPGPDIVLHNGQRPRLQQAAAALAGGVPQGQLLHGAPGQEGPAGAGPADGVRLRPVLRGQAGERPHAAAVGLGVVGRLHPHAGRRLWHRHGASVERRVGLLHKPLGLRLPHHEPGRHPEPSWGVRGHGDQLPRRQRHAQLRHALVWGRRRPGRVPRARPGHPGRHAHALPAPAPAAALPAVQGRVLGSAAPVVLPLRPPVPGQRRPDPPGLLQQQQGVGRELLPDGGLPPGGLVLPRALRQPPPHQLAGGRLEGRPPRGQERQPPAPPRGRKTEASFHGHGLRGALRPQVRPPGQRGRLPRPAQGPPRQGKVREDRRHRRRAPSPRPRHLRPAQLLQPDGRVGPGRAVAVTGGAGHGAGPGAGAGASARAERGEQCQGRRRRWRQWRRRRRRPQRRGWRRRRRRQRRQLPRRRKQWRRWRRRWRQRRRSRRLPPLLQLWGQGPQQRARPYRAGKVAKGVCDEKRRFRRFPGPHSGCGASLPLPRPGFASPGLFLLPRADRCGRRAQPVEQGIAPWTGVVALAAAAAAGASGWVPVVCCVGLQLACMCV